MITNFFKDLIANAVFHADSSSIPETYYIGLSVTEPTEYGGNISEPKSTTGYKRVSLDGVFSPADIGVIKNKEQIRFSPATSPQGVISHYCIFDNESGGNLCVYGSLSEAKQVGTQDILLFQAGDLEIQVVGQ